MVLFRIELLFHIDLLAGMKPLSKTVHRFLAGYFLLLFLGGYMQSFAQPNATPSVLRSGPMLGYSAMREVAIWVQTTKAAKIQYRYWDTQKPAVKKLSEAAATTAAQDFALTLKIPYLEPGVTYGYELLLDGKVVARPYPLRFKTNPLWQWRSDPPAFSVAFGSCAYINDPAYDRPGTPYGKDTKIFQSLAAQNPDLMLWIGDNTYYREADWDSPAMMSYRYAHTRQTPDMQAFLGSTHHYAIWDDHDFGPNDSDRSYMLKDDALDIFKRYWANPAYGFRDTPGTFFQFSWGDVDFFMLDNRFYRSPNATPDSTKKTILGEAQFNWLIDALTFSRAPFKIISIGGQTINDYKLYENFSTFNVERKHLLDEIIRRKINGVVFLSGDRHHTELLKYTPEGFYPIYDFTNSPLTSGSGKPSREETNSRRVENTLFWGQTFGLLQFSGPRTDRSLTMKTFDLAGKEVWSHTIKANDLRAAK